MYNTNMFKLDPNFELVGITQEFIFSFSNSSDNRISFEDFFVKYINWVIGIKTDSIDYTDYHEYTIALKITTNRKEFIKLNFTSMDNTSINIITPLINILHIVFILQDIMEIDEITIQLLDHDDLA